MSAVWEPSFAERAAVELASHWVRPDDWSAWVMDWWPPLGKRVDVAATLMADRRKDGSVWVYTDGSVLSYLPSEDRWQWVAP